MKVKHIYLVKYIPISEYPKVTFLGAFWEAFPLFSVSIEDFEKEKITGAAERF